MKYDNIKHNWSAKPSKHVTDNKRNFLDNNNDKRRIRTKMKTDCSIL